MSQLDFSIQNAHFFPNMCLETLVRMLDFTYVTWEEQVISSNFLALLVSSNPFATYSGQRLYQVTEQSVGILIGWRLGRESCWAGFGQQAGSGESTWIEGPEKAVPELGSRRNLAGSPCPQLPSAAW